jgi:hypothetical protein
MKSSRMRAKTNNAKTATKLLVAMTRAPHAEGQALRAQWLVPPLAGRPGRISRYGARRPLTSPSALMQKPAGELSDVSSRGGA